MSIGSSIWCFFLDFLMTSPVDLTEIRYNGDQCVSSFLFTITSDQRSLTMMKIHNQHTFYNLEPQHHDKLVMVIITMVSFLLN